MKGTENAHGLPLSRRRFLEAAACSAVLAGCQSAGVRRGGIPRRTIVLGVDGMDPQLLRKYIDAGQMPHCAALERVHRMRPLQTSNPPQSPVAWSSFITGMNPGGHGIFDFVARDPQTMQPYHSTARVDRETAAIRVGKWAIPTSSGQLQNLRHGPVFWDELERHGVPCRVFRVPANFPPSESEATTLAGMGTPDLQGGYGIFSYFTDDPTARSRDVSGGRIERVTLTKQMTECVIAGPQNEFSASRERVTVPIQIVRDPERPVARIVVQGTTIVLGEGEWSDWVVVKFTLVPLAVEVSGICRLYLQHVHGPFSLYVTPVNINPASPTVPLTTPPDYSKQLVRELGYFYTQGMVEDTHALSAGVLSAEEYRQQALFVHDERLRFLKHELNRFDEGFLFYYVSTLDLSSHVFWRTMDPGHPLYSAALAQSQGDLIPQLYRKVDEAVGLAMSKIGPEDWLIVMSDHGFTSFRRQFNLNSWLLDEGYLNTKGAPIRAGSTLFPKVDWARTRAFGVGINGLYLNRRGREASGIVTDAAADALLTELMEKLEAVRDPENDAPVISRVFRSRDIYQGEQVDSAPDLIVGYHPNYRASWDTILGGFPREQILDNTDAWSGDHCVDPQFVPGVLLSSRSLAGDTPRIEDLAPTILAMYHVPIPATMTGRDLNAVRQR